VRGEVRPGEMRHLISGISRARSIGFEPRVDLADGVQRYLGWIEAQGDVRDYFADAEPILREKRIVHRLVAGD
jgi:dTDP-L-rhamnose 4-epimerase